MERVRNPKERGYEYKVLQAGIGAKRLEDLDKQLKTKMASLSGSSGRVTLKHIHRSGSGRITPDNFHEIARALGIHLFVTEAGALYGRYDTNLDGQITFYEFLTYVNYY